MLRKASFNIADILVELGIKNIPSSEAAQQRLFTALQSLATSISTLVDNGEADRAMDYVNHILHSSLETKSTSQSEDNHEYVSKEAFLLFESRIQILIDDVCFL